MARRVFYSFHFKPDSWRASQVRNAGVVEGNQPVSDNDWEAVKRGGDDAVKKWIADQLNGRTCTVVLIGANTSTRKWVKHEIKESWNSGKGVAGIYVHRLKDANGAQSAKGDNPFDGFTFGEAKTPLSSVVKAYNPPGTSSTAVYQWIKDNLGAIVEEAIATRKAH